MMLLGPAVLAQPAGPTAPVPVPPPAPTAPAPAPGPADVDISVPQRPTLTPQDMINQSREYRARINEVVTRIQTQIEAAQKAKDIIRINCLTDKLVQARANLNIVDSATQSLQEAIARRDEGASIHEYTRITIVNQKVQVLGAEAEACVGEDLSFVGATRVDVEIDDAVPVEDPTQPIPMAPTPERPTSASPTG